MKQDYTEGSDNIFKDLGSANPEEKLAKAELIFIINKIISEKGLSQKEAAKILNVDQPKISALKCGKLSGFSIERLFSFLNALDQSIDVVVHQNHQKSEARNIHVAYT